MKKPHTDPLSTAEARLADAPLDISDEQQIHELKAHQIELEMQLKESQEQLRAITEANLQRTEEKEAILNALPAQIALIDPLGLIVAVNNRWGAFAVANAANSADFFIGHNYLAVCDAATGDCSEEAKTAAQGLRAVLSGQQPCFTLEYPCHSPQEERWFRLMVTPVSSSLHTGAVVMHLDITERKKAEQRLSEEQLRLTGLIDAAMDAIVTVDATQTIIRVNPAAEAMFSCPAAEILGRPLSRLIPTRFGAELAERLRAFGAPGTSCSIGELIAARGVRSDGREFPVEASISQVEVRGEKFYTAILRDVTERQQAEEDLKRNSEEMRALARRLEVIQDEQAAHIARELHDELGQTLTVLTFHVHAMQKRLAAREDEPPLGEASEAVELIETCFSSLRRLCAELRPPTLEHLGLVPALSTLAKDFQTHSGITCTLEAPADFPQLDQQLESTVYRIMQELLNNVARHAEASTVRIVLREMANTLELEVVDNGRGIADSEQTGTKSLGLLGMRERALAAGGTITFTGHPGQGTTAHACIPLAPPTTTPSRAAGSTSSEK